VKTDNSGAGFKSKVKLREMALDHVGAGAAVLDCFCGTGQMHDAVWSRAAAYAGCDQRVWDFTGPPRFVCDNQLLLRTLDLQQYNIFDLDAYGSPWKQAGIIAARRRWSQGERGAVVLTDGSSAHTRWGNSLSATKPIPGTGIRVSDEVERTALRSWVASSGVRVLSVHRAYSNGSGRGGMRMTYTAVLFEGQTASGN
jgi:hypothetical protein